MNWMPKWFAPIISVLSLAPMGYLLSLNPNIPFDRWECVLGGAVLGLSAGLVIVIQDLHLNRVDNRREVDRGQGNTRAPEYKEGGQGVFDRWFGR